MRPRRSRESSGGSSFFAGWLGTHGVVAAFYPTVGPWCINGMHFHHLYLGMIIAFVGLVAVMDNRSPGIKLFLCCLLAFGAGMAFDDAMDHFIVAWDPFEVISLNCR